uniref:Phospholipase-like protein n=1 Tax=Tanacetum cinerariifolium TaxID=118510 RepID=A0A6L2MJ40_TANCI|nr:phospholipase-like protein [Tanacetum cinerariifolium]
MWEKFYNRTINVVSRHTEHHLAQLKKNSNFEATYNLYGFTWAFKANVIPHGLAWSKVTTFEKSDYEELFGPMSNLNVALISSPKEMSQVWFKASVEFIKGLDDQDDTFFQDDLGREKFDNGDGVLDSQSDDGDGVLDSQTKDVIKEATMLPTMSSNSLEARNAAVSDFFAEFDALKKEVLLIKRHKDDDDCNPKKFDGGVSIEEKPNFSSHHNDSLNHIGGVSSEAKASSSSAHPENDDVSHLDDNMEINENSSIDSVVVVPLKVDDPMLCSIKTKDDFDEADIDSYDDDYMSLFNDEHPAKSLLNDLELQQELDIVDVKDRIFKQQANADKGKTTVIQETVRVTVKERPSLGRGLSTLKFKKKNCERALRPNYVLRSAKIRKKKMVMSLKSPFGQQSDTTLHLDLWIDLMWSLRLPEADWAIVSPHFSTCILNEMMPDYFSNRHMYPLHWIAIEKVYFLVNGPKEHWCLAQLKIRTRVVTFYDSLGWAGGSRRRWWRQRKKVLPEKLTLYLLMHGIFDSKGISADHYKITYNYASVPFQSSLYGNCGIWHRGASLSVPYRLKSSRKLDHEARSARLAAASGDHPRF